jgi:hypothetical protein
VKTFLSVIVAMSLCVWTDPAVAQVSPSEAQMDAAVLPLPASLRLGAGVLRWIGPGETEQLRPSQNGMSCSMDDPTDEQFDVRCYHDGFWVAIRRARQLNATLSSRREVADQLHREINSDQITLPSAPTAGYRMFGPISAFDGHSMTAGPEIAKWQSIHFPFRTSEEMGLSEVEEKSEMALSGLMPFVMASGTWWSHVMIVHEPFN